MQWWAAGNKGCCTSHTSSYLRRVCRLQTLASTALYHNEIPGQTVRRCGWWREARHQAGGLVSARLLLAATLLAARHAAGCAWLPQQDRHARMHSL